MTSFLMEGILAKLKNEIDEAEDQMNLNWWKKIYQLNMINWGTANFKLGIK